MKTCTLLEWTRIISKKKDAVILDVRTEEEFEDEHIPGALVIDIQNPQNFMSFIDDLDKAKPYFLYCGTGRRSNQACQVMQFNGFRQVFHLDGGFDCWKENNTL